MLSGEIFKTSRSSSPFRSPSRSRSPSPDLLWPTNGNSTDSDLDIPSTGRDSSVPNGPDMGARRTGGVKGVIQDRNEAVSIELAKHKQQIKDINRHMEKMALNGRTYAEEEEERVRDKERLEGPSAQADAAGRTGRRRFFERSGWFGHLREIGTDTFLEAVENELSGTWVLIHIYDPVSVFTDNSCRKVSYLSAVSPAVSRIRRHPCSSGTAVSTNKISSCPCGRYRLPRTTILHFQSKTRTQNDHNF